MLTTFLLRKSSWPTSLTHLRLSDPLSNLLYSSIRSGGNDALATFLSLFSPSLQSLELDNIDLPCWEPGKLNDAPAIVLGKPINLPHLRKLIIAHCASINQWVRRLKAPLLYHLDLTAVVPDEITAELATFLSEEPFPKLTYIYAAYPATRSSQYEGIAGMYGEKPIAEVEADLLQDYCQARNIKYVTPSSDGMSDWTTEEESDASDGLDEEYYSDFSGF